MLDGEFQESDIIMARDTALILTFLPQTQSIYHDLKAAISNF